VGPQNSAAFQGVNPAYTVLDDEKKKTNSMVRVRERTIPTEQPPLVGEVVANFCG
jgi:hypothetical protein